MKRISRTVLVLGLVSFFTDFSSEMIYPLLPFFLANVLGAGTVAIGLIEGVAEATASILKMFSGVWTDRAQQRKPFVFWGYSIASVVRPLMAFAQTWQTVLGLRFLDRVGKGIRTAPRDALIADVTPIENRGAAYGFHRAMDHAGSVIGPLVASLLMGAFALSMRKVFLVAAIPGAVSVALLFFGIREAKKERGIASSTPKPTFGDWRAFSPQFKWFLFSIFIFTLGNSTDAFLLLRLSKMGLPAGWIGGIWAAHHVVKMVANYFGGRVSDRLGRKPMMIMGWIVYALAYAGFAYAPNLGVLVAVFLAYGLYYGFVEPSEKALVSESVPAALRGTAFGYFHSIVGLGALPASLLFGWVWERWGAHNAFLMGAGLSLLASVMLLLTLRNRSDQVKSLV